MRYLAELYLPASTALAELAGQAMAGARQAALAGARVHFLQAIFVPQDESCFLVYLASSPAEVSAAGALAGLAFDRVVAAVCEPAPEAGADGAEDFR